MAVKSVLKRVSVYLRRAGAAIAVILGALPALASERLPLGPGDVVSVIYSGIGTVIPEVTVDEAGMLELQWLGAFQAEGRTSKEVQAEVKALADGRVFRHFNEAGDMELLPVSSGDIWLRVEQRRGITVYGNVNTSGEYPYKSNLTVRAVIGLAGGIQTALAVRDRGLSPMQVFDLQRRYLEALHESATLAVHLWGVKTRLLGDKAPAPPDPAKLGISNTVAEILIEEQLELTRTYVEAGENEMAFLKRALEQARERVEILKKQSAKQSEILAAEDEEVERVKELVARNLLPAQRLTETRRNTLLTSTRLLNIEVDLSQAEMAMTTRAREIELLNETRTLELLEERDKVRAKLIEAEARARQWGEGLGPFSGQSSVHLMANAPLIVIYRRMGEKVEGIEVDLDASVLPGDIVEVLARPQGLQSEN